MTFPLNAAQAAIEAELVCWKCKVANDKKLSFVAADFRTGTAHCIHCSADGPLEKFQPQPLPEGD